MATSTYSVTALTSPTSINATTAGNQLNGDLVALGNGDSVAVYADVNTGALLARKIGPSGAAIGAEVQVATGIDDSFARYANAAMLSNGDVVVTWADNGATQQVHYRVYDQNLNPLTSVQNVASPEAGGTSHPDVAALAGGGFVIAFQDDVSPGAADIYAQRYTAGGALNGSVILAQSGGSGGNPSVAGLVDGGFAISNDFIVGASTQMSAGIWNANGSLRLRDGVFNSVGTINTNSDAVALPSGGFVVNYEDNQWAAGLTDVSSAGFRATGSTDRFSRLTNSGLVNSDPKGAVSPDGYMVVSSKSSANDIFGALVDPTGQVLLVGSALDTGVGNHIDGVPVWIDPSHLALTESTDGAGSDGSGLGIASIIYHVVRTTTVTVAGDNADFSTDSIDNLAFVNGNNETFTAGGGNDTIHGVGNSDVLIGGPGNDLYIVGNATDRVIENPGEGNDTVETALSAYTLPANIEDLTGTSATGQYLVGNGLNNVIAGGAGNDTIDGGAGADTMIGGAGDDSYVVDNPGDVVIENPGGGIDSVITSLAAYTLPANVERLYGTSNSAQNLVGNARNDTIVGGAGADTIIAGTGSLYAVGGNGGATISAAGNNANDTLYGGSGNDYIVGGNGDDLIIGEAGSDTVYGAAGDDSIYGGAGTDYIYPGPGKDVIWTDDFGGPQSTDYIYEGGGTGIDTIEDFTPGNGANRDVLVINSAATGITNFAQLMADTNQVGAYSLINLGGGDQVDLYNIQPFQLTANDFIFQ